MDEPARDPSVMAVGLREGQPLPSEAGQSLANVQVPPLQMGGLAAAFLRRPVRLAGEDLLVGLPQVAKATAPAVALRDALPQSAAALCASVSDEEGHHLPRAPAQGNP